MYYGFSYMIFHFLLSKVAGQYFLSESVITSSRKAFISLEGKSKYAKLVAEDNREIDKHYLTYLIKSLNHLSIARFAYQR